MEYRLGTCSDCGARFKVPATFKADKAKCQKCKGVVTIGPIQSNAPAARESADQAPPVPARKPAPPRAGEPAMADEAAAPARKQRTGPSMKERLLAQRKAEAEAAAAAKPALAARAAKPAPTSRTRPVTRKRAQAADADETPSGSTRASRAGSARGARSGSSAVTRAGTSGRRATAGVARRRGARGEQDDEGATPRGRRGARAKQKSPAPIIGAVVIAILVGFGAWKFIFQEDETVNAGETDVTAAAPAVDPAADSAVEEAGEDSMLVVDEEAGEPAEDAAAEDDSTVEEEVKEAPPKKPADPDSVDLLELADFEPYGDTSEEEWRDMQQLVATYIDPDAGAAGRRAGNSLEEYGKKAIPAIINKFKTMEFATDQGYRDGDVTQRLLMAICSGTNVGWKYSTEPDDILFNKKAVALWHKIWDRAKDDEAYWNHIAKLGESPDSTTEGAAEKPAEAPPNVTKDDLDDLDSLGDG